MNYRDRLLLVSLLSVFAAWWSTTSFLLTIDNSDSITTFSVLDSGFLEKQYNEISRTATTTLSVEPEISVDYVGMDDRMLPAFLELLPDEYITLPVWDKNKNLVFGGKPLEQENYRDKGACSYPILEDSRPMGRCCIGSRSGGGGEEQFYGGAEQSCSQNITVYRQVQQYAMQDLESYPVQFDKNNPWNSPASHVKCDICRIVQVMASMKHNRFAIVGDSVQFQLFTGLECELRRRNFDVSSGKFKEWPIPSDLKQIPVGNQHGVKKEVCLNVTVPNWMQNPNEGHQNHRNRTISSYVQFCYYAHYKPFPDMRQHKIIAESSDVMMIDYGLHYGRDLADEYRSTLLSLFKAFAESECLLMYRETSAQHFDSNGGEWNTTTMRRQYRRGRLKCAPLDRTSDRIKWRTKIFEEVVADSSEHSLVHSFQNPRKKHETQVDRTKEVALLPFYDWSSMLFSLKDGVDCTHFCYTPHIYYSMWRHIRIALDRQDMP